jgi:uncharacterized protein (TIGR02246 family)
MPTLSGVGVSEQVVADRLALRSLADAYAQAVDRGDAAAVAGLFTDDGRLVSRLQYPGGDGELVRQGRDEIASAIGAGLERYLRTTHVVGGQVVAVDGARATGETVCLAHHVYDQGGVRRLLVMAVRYTDTYVRAGGRWLFAERRLDLDWRQDSALEDR